MVCVGWNLEVNSLKGSDNVTAVNKTENQHEKSGQVIRRDSEIGKGERKDGKKQTCAISPKAPAVHRWMTRETGNKIRRTICFFHCTRPKHSLSLGAWIANLL